VGSTSIMGQLFHPYGSTVVDGSIAPLTAGRPRNHRRLPTTAEAPAAVCVLAYSSTPERHLR